MAARHVMPQLCNGRTGLCELLVKPASQPCQHARRVCHMCGCGSQWRSWQRNQARGGGDRAGNYDAHKLRARHYWPTVADVVMSPSHSSTAIHFMHACVCASRGGACNMEGLGGARKNCVGRVSLNMGGAYTLFFKQGSECDWARALESALLQGQDRAGRQDSRSCTSTDHNVYDKCGTVMRDPCNQQRTPHTTTRELTQYCVAARNHAHARPPLSRGECQLCVNAAPPLARSCRTLPGHSDHHLAVNTLPTAS